MAAIDLLATICIPLAMAVSFMTAMFIVARRYGRYDIVDMAWGLTFIVIALTSLFVRIDTGLEMHYANLVVTGLVIVWGVRLSSHIYRRLRSTKSEDKRYVEIRNKWQGSETLNIYTRIFITQAILAVIIMSPVLVLNGAVDAPSTIFLIIGTVVWLVGFYFEATADRQLRAFISNKTNKGKLMTSGLWAYSRHPNYFGEMTQWWGIGVIVLGIPFGFLGLVGPILITYLLVFVSGVPLTEKSFANRPGWNEYKRRTSVLVPLPPRGQR